jgi:hypothetical protein
MEARWSSLDADVSARDMMCITEPRFARVIVTTPAWRDGSQRVVMPCFVRVSTECASSSSLCAEAFCFSADYQS